MSGWVVRPKPGWQTARSTILRFAPNLGEGGSRYRVQLDFDARTRHLDRYATFLADVRKRLPRRYKLSITGLMDWSANGDPKALAALAGTVDEVVIQTYQGRTTIPGYEAYFKRLASFPIQFKVVLSRAGSGSEPRGLAANPKFKVTSSSCQQS